ncbi:MAG: hypothetical protein ACK5E4_12300 [Planctomycetia bacterium]|jgi:seryl-tRNA synthetase
MSFKNLLFAGIGLFFFVSSSAFAVETQEKKEPSVPAIEKKLEANPLESINHQLKEIQLSIQSLKSIDSDNRIKKIDAEISIIKDQISRLEQAISKINSTRSAASYTPPVAASATIKVVNTSAWNSTVLINGKTHKVPSMQTITLGNQNVGDFTYQVLADNYGIIQPTTTRTIGQNETFTISIYPR